MSTIPKIIHQSYKTTAHPYPQQWQKSWKLNHPNWEYRFYSDTDNRALVQQHFPQFLNAFDLFPQGIMRADFARFIYMYVSGGLYVDLDYICLRPLGPLIDTIEHIGIPTLPRNQLYQYHNALLISEPGNKFWLSCAKAAAEYFEQTQRPQVEWLAGPLRLQETILKLMPSFTPLAQQDVTPIDWATLVPWGRPSLKAMRLVKRLKDSDVPEMREEFPDAYALTVWAHGWHEDI